MLLSDVTLLVYANRADSPRHDEYRQWLEQRLDGIEPFGVSEYALGAFVRIATNASVYKEPTPMSEAVDFCEAVLGAPAAVPIRPGARHWPLFTDLCLRAEASGNLAPDAYLAALALEHGATLVAADRGFPRYPGLRMQHPLESEHRLRTAADG